MFLVVVWWISSPVLSSPILWQRNLCPGFDLITTSQRIRRKPLSLAIALVVSHAAYVALRHPEVFGNVLSRSGAFWWSPEHNGGVCGARCPDLADAAATVLGTQRPKATSWLRNSWQVPNSRCAFYLAAGTFESDTEGGGGGILESTRHLRDVLLAKGYQVHYQQFVGGHDGLSWRGALADGLINLLGVH